MKAWSYWFPDLMPHVPGCPQVLAKHELRRAAQAFFHQTRAWQIDKAAVPVVASQETVSLAPADADQELVRLESAWYDGKPLDPTTAEALDASYADDWRSHTGTPFAFFQLVPGEIRLYPLPMADATTGVTARLSVRPSETSTGLPDDMAIRFRDEIHVGAKARLMLYPGKPWSNPDLAGVYGMTFSDQVGAANARAARSFAQARIPARPKWC